MFLLACFFKTASSATYTLIHTRKMECIRSPVSVHALWWGSGSTPPLTRCSSCRPSTWMSGRSSPGTGCSSSTSDRQHRSRTCVNIQQCLGEKTYNPLFDKIRKKIYFQKYSLTCKVFFYKRFFYEISLLLETRSDKGYDDNYCPVYI